MGDWDIKLDRSILGDDDWRNEDYRTGCHEAAHAVVVELMGARVNFIRLLSWDDMAETNMMGHTSYRDSGFVPQVAGRELAISLAGVVFEKLLYRGKGKDTHYKGDMEKAQALSRMMTGGDGSKSSPACEKLFANAVVVHTFTADETLERTMKVARQMVVENWPLILAIGKRLACEGELTGSQVRNMMARAA
ncbi:MAG: hypothetical protein ABSH01_08205 [Terriglobia bacterium]|jgi:hypothetical protein